MSSDQGKRYDNIAAKFAAMRNSFNTEKKYLDIFTSHLQPNCHILDVGCGSGYPIADYLINKGFCVTGLDSSSKLLELTKKYCPAMKCIHGDVRTITLPEKYDAIIEWWCLFHLPKEDQIKMLARFASWLKTGGILEFTTGDREYAESDSVMLNQQLDFYSHNPKVYEKHLKKNGFKILLRENDQEQHLVWLAKRD